MTTTPRLRKGASKPKAAKPYVMTTADKARMAVKPSINGASVIQAYQGNVMGKDADMSVLIDQLRDTFTEVKGGDLHTLEVRISAIVDACFRLIVDGVSAPLWTCRGCAQARD